MYEKQNVPTFLYSLKGPVHDRVKVLLNGLLVHFLMIDQNLNVRNQVTGKIHVQR